MPDVDVVFRRPARRFYDNSATFSERIRITAIVSEICGAPAADEKRKFQLGSGEVLYHDGMFWILYRALNNWTIEVIGIGTVIDESAT
jgi:hypothetical protein